MTAVQIAAVAICASALGLVRTASPQQAGREGLPPAQQPGRGASTGRGAAAPAFMSPEVLPDKRFATGTEDRLMPTTRGTVELFKKHGFTPILKESPGGHTWANWRDYLNEFAPRLFH